MMSGPAELKAALRQRLRAETVRRSPSELAEASRAICQRMMEQSIWREANSVLLYAPVSGEPDVRPLLQAALKDKKAVALPRFDAAGGAYEACEVIEPGRQLVSGQYGILEPHQECPVIELNKLDLALVPGIGFSLNGCRLGRGKGYFDRILNQVRGWKCGVAFDWQVAVEIPAEQHDIRVDSILTPTRWHVVRL